jgi:nucleoside-diphosphate-sugar epimerase
MAKTAFVTGGTGFLGRHVVEQLTTNGWRVVALHRPTSDTTHLKAYGVDLALGSITDPDSLARAMPDDCDAVFHVAGNTSFWSGGDAQQTHENVDGTRFMVETAIAKRARFFVQTSSESAWGEQHDTPFDESSPSNAPSSPINYERTKYLGELEIEKGIAKGLRACMLAPGHILGKYDTSQWARLFLLVHTRKLPGVPPGKGTWAHATEVAKAHVAAVTRGKSGERYLLGGAHATYLDVVRVIGELVGQPVPEKATPPWMLKVLGRVSQWGSYFTRKPPTVSPEMAIVASRPAHLFKSDKAVRELGYREASIDEMLRETYEWLKAQKLLD